MCPLVAALLAQLSRSARDDSGTRPRDRPHDYLPLVRCSAPELEKRCRPHLKSCNDSWRVDEKYIKIKKTWRYLYRAVDSQRNTLEFLLSPTRDAEAAKRFFITALGIPTCSVAQGSRDRAARGSADQWTFADKLCLQPRTNYEKSHTLCYFAYNLSTADKLYFQKCANKL